MFGSKKGRLALVFLPLSLIIACAPPPAGGPTPGGEPNFNSTNVPPSARARAGQFFKNLGLAAMTQQNYSKAIAKFTEGTKVNPGDAELWKNLGEAYMAAKFYDDAEKAFKKALKLKPDYGDVMYDLGLLYAAQGKYEKAIEWFRKAAELPTFENRYLAYYEMARTYLLMGDVNDYLKYMNYAINLYPRFGPAVLSLARFYASRGNVNAAIRYYSQYLMNHPNNEQVVLEFVGFLIKHKKFKIAKRFLKTLINTSQNPQTIQRAYRLINELLKEEALQRYKQIQEEENGANNPGG
jgi:tetratricopeptide (TPR) repeat protein